jgi:hypothetical protein
VFAYFESQGFYACDMNGALLWQTDLGDKTMRNEFGEAARRCQRTLYFLTTNSGLLAVTGKPHYPLQRLEDAGRGLDASPALARDTIYLRATNI